MTTLSPYLASLRRTRLLQPQEERALVEDARSGDRRALERLVQSNLPFVLKVAKDYRGMGVPFEDLVAEGNLGLLEAAPRFDPAHGTRFITYAMWWIRKRMRSALEMQSRVVRVPRYSWERRKTPALAPQVPIEIGFQEGWGRPLIDRLHDPCAPHVEKDLVHRETLRRVLSAVARLSTQERRVLDHRFGLRGEPPLTLHQTGERLRVSRERVRQIEQQAMARLRRLLAGQRYPRARDALGAAAPLGPQARHLAV